MDAIVSSIESQLQNSLQTEVPSSQIGDMVMQRLKDVDEVAYVRFASVYRQFKDIDAFIDELMLSAGIFRLLYVMSVFTAGGDISREISIYQIAAF